MVIVLPAMTTLPLRIARGIDRLDLTAPLQHGDLEAAACRNRARRILVLERVEGGAHQIVGIRRPKRLGDHILDAERFEHGAHRAAGDNAGAGRRGTHYDASRAMAAARVMVQGAAFAQGNAHEAAPRRLGRLADGFGHLASLAMAETDTPLLVADHD